MVTFQPADASSTKCLPTITYSLSNLPYPIKHNIFGYLFPNDILKLRLLDKQMKKSFNGNVFRNLSEEFFCCHLKARTSSWFKHFVYLAKNVFYYDEKLDGTESMTGFESIFDFNDEDGNEKTVTREIAREKYHLSDPEVEKYVCLNNDRLISVKHNYRNRKSGDLFKKEDIVKASLRKFRGFRGLKHQASSAIRVRNSANANH